MRPASHSANEHERLKALRSYAVLDTPADPVFDDLTTLAAYACAAPMALISLIDENRQWLLSRVGLNRREGPRTLSFCAHAIQQKDLFLVPDASADERFADNPYVLGPPYVRFYAGICLVSPEGFPLGTLCVIDRIPRELLPEQEQALRVLGHQVMTQLELRRQQAVLAQLCEKRGLLLEPTPPEQQAKIPALAVPPKQPDGACACPASETTRAIRLVTEQMRAQASLVREVNLSNAIINGLPGAFYLYDEDGNFIRWNRNLEEVTGYTGEEIAAMHPLNLVRPADREFVAARIKEAIELGSSYAETALVAKDGTLRDYYLTGHGVVVDGRRCLLGMGLDLTARRQLERRLQTMERIEGIGQIGAGLAHDFNNMLMVIQAHTDILLATKSLPAQMVTSLKQIAEAAERSARLTRQLLMLGRKQVMQIEPLNINEVLQQMSPIIERLLGPSNRLTLSLASDLPLVRADVGMLEQVLINLTINARDAIDQTGAAAGLVTLCTERVDTTPEYVATRPDAHLGTFVRLSVSDSGTGIAKEHLKRIFEPFFSTKEAGKGTGLGLPTVFSIVRQHQGWLEVTSQPGLGTTFHAYLPVSDAASKSLAPKQASPEAYGRGSEGILLVEDEPSVCEVVEHVLSSHGYHVIAANSGEDALTKWAEHRAHIDLLLTDIVMPGGMNGRDLAHKLWAERPDLKVIYTSGYTGEAVRSDLDEYPQLRYLAKPYNPISLTQMVRELLDKAPTARP